MPYDGAFRRRYPNPCVETDFHPRRSHFTALCERQNDRRLLLSNEYMGTFIAEKMTNLAVESKDKEMVKCK